MKLNTLILILLLFSGFVRAASITAIQNGNWNAASTWDLARTPADNDVVIIPSDRIVDFNGSPYPKNTPSIRPTLKLRIYGTLDFSAAGNDKLYLDAGSTIEIHPNGKIQTSSFSTEIIAIFNGLLDNTVWSGFPTTINGPANATATTFGFSNGILPIKLNSFVIERMGPSLGKLMWVSSTEVNSNFFEIQSSLDGGASWKAIGNVTASHFSTIEKEYQFSVQLKEGRNDFRLKQLDIDGTFTFSQIVSMQGAGNSKKIKVYYRAASNELIINHINRDAVVTIFDLSGKRQMLKKVTGSVTFKPTAPGIYIVSVSDSQTSYISKLYLSE